MTSGVSMANGTAGNYWICGGCGTPNAMGVTRCRACGKGRTAAARQDQGDAEARKAGPSGDASGWDGWTTRGSTDVTRSLGRWSAAHRRALALALAICLVAVLLVLLGVRAPSAIAVWLAGLAVLVGVELYWSRGHSFREDLRALREGSGPSSPAGPAPASEQQPWRPVPGPVGAAAPRQGPPGPPQTPLLPSQGQPMPPPVIWRPPDLRPRGPAEATGVPPVPPAMRPPPSPPAAPPGPAAEAAAPPAAVAPAAPMPLRPRDAVPAPPSPSAPIERCPHCGADIEAGSDLCQWCGHRFPLSRLAPWTPSSSSTSKPDPS